MSHVKGQDLIGKVLGDCVLEQLLGYGGSGAVFLARQRAPERQVAVKVFLPRHHPDRAMREEFHQRFLQEARAASELLHPAILPIYAYGQEAGLAYIVMPYMPGGTLADYVRRHGPLTLEEAGRYLEQIAAALDYAHERGCIHCDVKPANILLDGNGRAFLADFGIARLLPGEPGADNAQDPAEGLRPPISLAGTPEYIAPEQALNQEVDQRADIYSLGVTLFYMLAGHPPFKADSALALVLLHLHEQPPALSELDARIPPQVDYVLHKALAKFPEERFPSATLLSAAYQAAIREPQTPPPLRLRIHGLLLPRWIPLRLAQRLEALNLPHRSESRFLLLALICLVLACPASLAGLLTVSRAGGFGQSTHSGSGSPPTATDPATLDRLLTGADDWPHSSSYFFADGEYHVLNTSARTIALVLYAHHSFGDFHLAVKMREVRGSHDGADFYGVAFRASSDQRHYYLFEVMSWGGGAYAFLRYENGWMTLAEGTAPALLIGQGQTNRLEIDAHGSTFRFFINGRPVMAPLSDPSPHPLLDGSIGLYVEEEGTEIAFSQLQIGPAHF
jgi:serine/threonine protein kinase